VSDERYDDIAARLRAEAGAQAPERLRTDVMLRVRAEPRPRRIRPRHRRAWRPLGAVAAVACVLAALVVGLNHGGGSGPESAFTSAGGGVAGAGATRAAPQASHATEKLPNERPAPLHVHGAYGTATSAAGRAFELRAGNLPPRLRRALEALIRDHGRGAH
jgi:negative regulator of sigma E activity